MEENEFDLHDMHMEEQLWPTLPDDGTTDEPPEADDASDKMERLYDDDGDGDC